MRTLGEDIVLLALRGNGGFHAATKLRYALSGAELVQLVVARRVGVVGDKLTVLDPSPLGDPLLDAALADIVSRRRPARAKQWVAHTRPGQLDAYLAELASVGTVRQERRKMLGVLPSTRWLLSDETALAHARARLDAIALSTVPVEASQAALGGLVHAIGLDSALYPGSQGRAARKRLASVARRDPASAAVNEALEAVQSSLDVAVDSAVHAAVEAAVHASVDAAHHAAAHHDGGGGAGGGHH